MHEHIATNQHNPTQKISQKSQKPQNLGLKMHECMKMKGLKTHTKRLRLDLGRKLSG